MNGKTEIDQTMNPCTAEMDKKTYGWMVFNVCFWGNRIVRVTFWRLTLDIYKGMKRPFTSMGGGANGTARYWQLFWWLGSVMWITRQSNNKMKRT